MCVCVTSVCFLPTFCVVILSNIRNIDIEGKEDGKTLFQLLDAFRNECKVCLYTLFYWI